MAVTFRAAGTASTGNAAVTPGIPAGTVTDDILLCFVQSSNEAISVPTNVGGTNWTTATWVEVTNSPQGIGTAASAGAVRLGVFWLRITAAMTIGTVSVADTGNHTCAFILGYSGCETTGDPWNITAGQTQNNNSGLLTQAAMTTTAANCRIVFAYGNAADVTTNQYSSNSTNGNLDAGQTNRTPTGANTTTGTGGGMSVTDSTLTVAGAIGTVAINIITLTVNSADLAIALKPPAPAVVLPELITEPMVPARSHE